jgi:ATP-dependent DNA ligase
VKATRTDDFVVGGFTRGFGAREYTLGALLLGYYDDSAKLVYAGHVGSGFDNHALREIRTLLDRLTIDRPPFSEPQDESNQRFGSGYVTKSPTNRKASESSLSKALKVLAGGKGFEPLFTESEAVSVIVISIG